MLVQGGITLYRVLIVDDDDKIVTSLCRLLPWTDYACEVVGTANEGESALKLAQYFHPDILFTDISMPDIDGIHLIVAMRKILPNLQITVLSAFADFDYAKRALRLGVTNYVLKPISFTELEDSLCEMTNHLAVIQAQADDRNIRNSTNEPKLDPIHISEDSGNFILNNALQYIEKNYTKKLTLSMVADEIYVSQWHLSKIISKFGNGSFNDIVNNVRISHAKELLSNPTYKIQDISEQVGFASVNHFARTFKSMENCSANEYRNQLSDNHIYASDKKRTKNS